MSTNYERIEVAFNTVLRDNPGIYPLDGAVYKEIIKLHSMNLHSFDGELRKFKNTNQAEFKSLTSAPAGRPETLERNTGVYASLLDKSASVPSPEDVYIEVLQNDPAMPVSTFVRQLPKITGNASEQSESSTPIRISRRAIKPYSLWVEIHGSVPRPTHETIEGYIKDWKCERMKHYQEQEECIKRLFRNPDTKKRDRPNDTTEVILNKILMLNSFYSTKLHAPLRVAKYIGNIENFYASLNDPYDRNKDELVNTIAKGDVHVGDNEKYETLRECFSFATKYCHHHNPEYFRIYDSYVAKILRYFQQKQNPCFYREGLSETKMKRDYSFFHDVLEKFKENFGLDGILEKLKKEYAFTSSNEVLDKYLWLLGKRYFQKPPKK